MNYLDDVVPCAADPWYFECREYSKGGYYDLYPGFYLYERRRHVQQAYNVTINTESINKRLAETPKTDRKPKLLNHLREALRSHHYSSHTE
ncbi:MAG: hypothetical protein ACUBOA_10835 [Candidatus Loosdrechtia sp.]|uniref:hypothetical protein n=1 Tax=Candidatus Loosdrechtia sp. TaxID=3101272 RepID=UPI003A61F25D|nr:MAG: hypothetical protein QY305_14880 [Candidatus Jettenia sp. AMX2]